jgi:hypothetical protein
MLVPKLIKDLLPIAPTGSPAIANTHVGGSFLFNHLPV